MSFRVESGPGWELRLGRWQDVLADVAGVSAVITDPPYSKRQIAGFRSGSLVKRRQGQNVHAEGRFVIPYYAIEESEARELAAWARSLDPWWFVSFGDHVLWRWLEADFEPKDIAKRWCVFAPLIWGKPNPPPRMCADGPCCAAEHIFVVRPRRRLPAARRGHRPGWYFVRVLQSGGAARELDHERVVGEKPLELMRRIVLDYTLPGDLIVDPYAGNATTLAAAIYSCRRVIGAEADPGRFEQAVARLRAEQARAELAARQASLFPERTRAKQIGLGVDK